MQEDLQQGRNQCMSCILKHENAMNIFYARCLLFARLVCVLISMNWIIHKKFKFMKWSKSRIYCLPRSEIYSKKTWRFYALEANKKCNWIIAKKTNLRSESNFMTPFRQFRIYLFFPHRAVFYSVNDGWLLKTYGDGEASDCEIVELIYSTIWIINSL